MTADFNRLSVMFMRLDETSGIKTARKVSTATMSCARLQASIGIYFWMLAADFTMIVLSVLQGRKWSMSCKAFLQRTMFTKA